MIEAVYAQLRTTASLLFGVPFSTRALDRLAEALRASYEEFGSVGRGAQELIAPAALDAEAARDLQLRRFRAQASRAAEETPYYGRLFAELGLDPRRLRLEDIQALPLTGKAALKADPDAFVRRSANVAMRIGTTGTTGRSTGVGFSAYELHVMAALAAVGLLMRGARTPADVVLSCISSRAVVANPTLSQSAARIGCMLIQAGIVEPDLVLDMLVERRHTPGKKGGVSILESYPSYLGELAQRGLDLGLGPAHFQLERISTGAEIVTEGLRTRVRRLFGDIALEEGYAMTEILPVSGQRCEQGHLHFEITQGLVEVISLDQDRPVAPGEVGRLVVTPLPPFREATMLLRYDTQDLVRRPAETPTCSLQALPATSDLLGKQALSIRLDDGRWIFPRQIREALESVEAVPLPARCGYWAEGDGVAVEVVARDAAPAIRRALGEALEREGVPLSRLILRDSRAELRRPYPLRCDLREALFAALPAPAVLVQREIEEEVRV